MRDDTCDDMSSIDCDRRIDCSADDNEAVPVSVFLISVPSLASLRCAHIRLQGHGDVAGFLRGSRGRAIPSSRRNADAVCDWRAQKEDAASSHVTEHALLPAGAPIIITAATTMYVVAATLTQSRDSFGLCRRRAGPGPQPGAGGGEVACASRSAHGSCFAVFARASRLKCWCVRERFHHGAPCTAVLSVHGED